MVARGAERDGGLPSALGGWRLEPPPQPRGDAGAARWLSLIALLAAVGVAIAAVFLTRPEQSGPTPIAASAPTVAQPAEAVAPSVPPPAAATRPDRTEAVIRAQPAFRSSQTTAAAEPVGSTAQSSLSQASQASQAAVEAAATTELRAAVVATSDAAEREIRAYIGARATDMLPPAFAYTVEAGDTVSKIAARFGLQEATIRFNNFDIYDPDMLEVGARLQLPVRDGVIYVVQSGDTLEAVLKNYAAELDATLAFAGNAIASADYITVEQTLLLVGGSASIAGGYSTASGASTAAWTMPTFGWPMSVTSISDPFGVPRGNAYGYHTGVDWPAPIGTIVGATAAGVVSYAGWDGGYGYWVEVDHGGGVRSRYAHLNEIFVVVGEWLGAGGYVGTVGNTGASSGAHLHFEIIMGGEPVDPYRWLQ